LNPTDLDDFDKVKYIDDSIHICLCF